MHVTHSDNDKSRMDRIVRDIDDWMFHFERQVGSRLKKLFGNDTKELPDELAMRLKKLREIERRDDGEGAHQKPARR